MKRRALLTFSAGAAAFVLAGHRPALAIRAGGHDVPPKRDPFGPRLADLNPDRMWPVYRRYHLLIVSQRDDDRSGALTTAVVEVLSRYLPSSRPQLVRRCRMTDRGATARSGPAQPLRQRRRPSCVALALSALLFTASSPRQLAAHETIDAERANAILAAADAAATPTMRSAATGCRRPRSSRRCISRRKHRTPCERGLSFSKPASTRASCSIFSSLSA